MATISIPVDDDDDVIKLTRLDLNGDEYQRGFDQGWLLSDSIADFIDKDLNEFFKEEIENLNINSLPVKLQDIIQPLLDKLSEYAPEIFWRSMSFVWESEKDYVPEYLKDEMRGIAEGICSGTTTSKDTCNATEWNSKVNAINMLPELIRMSCTSIGAWGNATTHSGLVQLRALDFGSGPFANHTTVTVHHPADEQAFLTVGFPAFVGVVTGISERGVGVSEKVWETYDKPGIQPGSYDGLADTLVIRHILQNSINRKEAVDYVKSIKRTWSVWLGIGDYESGKLDLIGYRQADVNVYNDETTPTMTGQPAIPNVAYIDKHPQPSHATDLPELINNHTGKLDFTAFQDIVQKHETGDLHFAVYDFSSMKMMLAIGRIDGDGNYGGDGKVWKAYNRPAIIFDLNDIWNGV